MGRPGPVRGLAPVVQAVSRSSSASGSTRVSAAGASERRNPTTASRVRAQGSSVFQVSTCSGTWKSPFATAGRPDEATQAKTRCRLISSNRWASERSSASRQN